MSTCLAQRLVAVARVALWLMLANMSWAADNQQYQLTNGLAVYIGILPAGMTMPRFSGDSPGDAHGGAPAWGEQYHVIVAIFDNASGTRVADAEVSSAVFNTSVPGKRLSGPEKTLEPMQVADDTVYGNYFEFEEKAYVSCSFAVRKF